MAYNDNFEGNVSEWNEALYKMKRLHEIQEEINKVSINPLVKHYLHPMYNYQVWFQLIGKLYGEGHAKYKDPEREEIDRYKNTIEMLMEYFPVHKNISVSGWDGHSKKAKFNKENWEKIKKLMEIMELKVKFYNDIHGLSTKNAESMDGRSILR